MFGEPAHCLESPAMLADEYGQGRWELVGVAGMAWPVRVSKFGIAYFLTPVKKLKFLV
jgi:hypothetical protein